MFNLGQGLLKTKINPYSKHLLENRKSDFTITDDISYIAFYLNRYFIANLLMKSVKIYLSTQINFTFISAFKQINQS